MFQLLNIQIYNDVYNVCVCVLCVFVCIQCMYIQICFNDNSGGDCLFRPRFTISGLVSITIAISLMFICVYIYIYLNLCMYGCMCVCVCVYRLKTTSLSQICLLFRVFLSLKGVRNVKLLKLFLSSLSLYTYIYRIYVIIFKYVYQ